MNITGKSLNSSFFRLYTLSQVFDVFTDKTMMLKDSTDFVVSVNPTGVVMWYVSAPAKMNLHQFYKGDKLKGAAHSEGDENTIFPVFLWQLTLWSSQIHCLVLKR